MRFLIKNLKFGFLCEFPKDLPDVDKIKDYQGHSVSIPLKMCNSRLIRKFHKKKMLVVIWFYMSDNEDYNLYRRLKNFKVDKLITNYPNLV